MTECPALRTLQDLLAGLLADPLRDDVRSHVRGCDRCRAALDQLTDDGALRSFAPLVRQTAPDTMSGPQLRRILDELCATPVRKRGTEAASLLAPPRDAADIGALGPIAFGPSWAAAAWGWCTRRMTRRCNASSPSRCCTPNRPTTPPANASSAKRAAARFRHEHAVGVHAIVSTDDAPPYLVMEYVAGPTLRAHLRARQGVEPHEAVALLVGVIDALAAAHAAGLIHRDVKPSNILLEPDAAQPAGYRARLGDFGLARLAERAGELTAEGCMAGTPAYMSPEQVRQPDAVDGRSDVYGMGVTMYETLTGEAPFRGSPARVLDQVLNDEPQPPRQLKAVPADLETICLKAMAKERQRRYATAADLADDLRRWQRGEPIRARPAGRAERLFRWGRRNPRVASLSAALLVACLAGLSGVLWQWSHAVAERGRAESERDTAVVQRTRPGTSSVGPARRSIAF